MRIFPLWLILSVMPACVMSRTERGSDSPQEILSPDETIQAAAALIAGTGSRRTPSQVLANLERHGGSPEAEERETMQALTPLVEKLAEGKELTTDDYRTAKVVMSKAAARRPNDFATQHGMTVAITAVESLMQARGEDGSNGRESRAKELVARFPGQALAHAHLGQVTDDVDPALAMRSFARCIKLDPGVVACKDGLKASAARYQEPRCAQISAKKLAFHAAYLPNAATAKAGRKGLKPIKVDSRQLLMETKASLDGTAVDDAQQSGEGKDTSVTLTFSPQGAATLAAQTTRLAERQGFLVIMVEGKVHAAPQVMSPIESGTVRMSGVTLVRLCTKLEARPLPPDVAGLIP